jgi:hypothetical protein
MACNLKAVTQINHANDADPSMTWFDTHLIKTDASMRTDTLAHQLATTPLLSVETQARLREQRGS